MRQLLTVLCLVLALPVASIFGAWLNFDARAWAVLAHQASTVLPGYAAQSLLLAAGVGLGVALLGTGAAVAVALFRFPGRAVLEWALLLPLAMPAYVLAYVYTDALQYSGPVQGALRTAFGWQGALWPDVRSLWGAMLLFILCLYPYVYLLTRAALGERAMHMMEAAALLGAGQRRRVLRVALPVARPAVAGGVVLALMETLADYGVGSYFGLTTFTTGIYRAWLSMNDATAAAQLASFLLMMVALLLVLERRAQSKLRFSVARDGARGAADAQALVLRGAPAALAVCVCAVPVLLGFVLPASWLALMFWREAADGPFGLPLARFGQWAWASFKLSTLAAVAATGLALALGLALRRQRPGSLTDAVLGAAARMVSLGYAVPGAVIAIGLLLPLAWAQSQWPNSGVVALFTGTTLGVVFAYVVRFSAVAMQSIDVGYSRVSHALDDTARTLGSGPLRIFTRLHLPLLQRSALAAALLVFVDTMKELPATLALRPFGSDTLAVAAYQLARDERLAEAALPSLAIVIVGLLPVALLARAVGR